MSLRLVPHDERWRDAVQALNVRAAARGQFGFFEDPVPRWLAPGPQRAMFREYIVALDELEARGGYVLKREPARLAGADVQVASVQGPYSEGAADPRQAKVFFAMARDLIQRSPLAYGWGLERREQTVMRLFGALGWQSHATPLLLWLGLPVLFPERRADRWHERYTEVPSFDAWADELWAKHAARYAFVVHRTSKLLLELYPPERQGFRRLLVERDGRAVGWALVGVRKFRRHRRFRSARVGVVWDFFAPPEEAPTVVRAALHALRRSGAWAVLASTSHRDWIRAFQSSGFYAWRERRHWLVSKALAARLHPFGERAADGLLTFADAENYTGTLGQAIFGEPGGGEV